MDEIITLKVNIHYILQYLSHTDSTNSYVRMNYLQLYGGQFTFAVKIIVFKHLLYHTSPLCNNIHHVSATEFNGLRRYTVQSYMQNLAVIPGTTERRIMTIVGYDRDFL